MIENELRTKRRGFVMTGGGAKGLYEAGVIYAFHMTGMEFDIMTGSSIGAMNSVFFAEYLLCKKGLPPEVRSDPEQVVEAMERKVRQFHHAWLMLPTVRVIDDSDSGPIGKLKNDLLRFNVSLPQLTRLVWWWTDPQRGKIPPPSVVVAGTRVLRALVRSLGGAGQLFRIAKERDENPPAREAFHTYLSRFGMERSLVPDEDDTKLKDVFTKPVTPLRLEHLTGEVAETPPEGESGLVDPNRTMRDYYQAGIDVRLTRANYRTGRLEISSYLSQADFIRWLERQAWRLQSGDPDEIPLGSFRLQMPGNPNAIHAGLASGRFPGVFAPFPIAAIYPSSDPENGPLHDLLANWLDGPSIQQALRNAYLQVHRGKDAGTRWENHFESWRNSETMASIFANVHDAYVDGGAIDNTPTNSVVDAVREWVDREGLSKREVVLEMFVIFLHPEPKVDQVKAESPATFEVVGRTLKIQSAAKLASDALTVKTINYFGQQGEDLGQALLLLLEALKSDRFARDGQPPEGLEDALQELVKQRGLQRSLGSNPDGILERIEKWAEQKIKRGLPIHVDEITIHPEKMPLDTLQFTERFGYRKKNAIDMLTMGCYNTVWALRHYLENPETQLDDRDRQVLKLTQKWMNIDPWPDGDQERLHQLQQTWRCARTACVFHEQHCPHGARKTRSPS